MKRRIILSIALFLSIVLVSLMSSDQSAKAQPPQRFKFASGIITPGTGQVMRITIGCGGGNYCLTTGIRILQQQYTAAGCAGTPAVCRQTIASQSASPVIPLGNDALTFDVQGTGNGVNVVVESNNRDVRVNVLIIDSATGEVVAFQKHWEIIA